MLRNTSIFCVVALACTLVAGESFAQIDAPPAQPGAPSPGIQPAAPAAQPAAPGGGFTRGGGHYLSWIKILACWLVFLCWVATTDWLSTDCQNTRLKYLRWNPIVFGTFLGAFFLVWILPWFWVSFPLLVIAYATPLIWYIIYRNSKVETHQKVLTRAHFRFLLAKRLSFIDAEKKAPWEIGPPVTLEADGDGADSGDSPRLLASRQTLGFNEARGLMAEALFRRASAAMLDYTSQSVGIRYMIDGVWHGDEPQTREACDPLLESLKILCGLNPQDRQNKQKGAFASTYDSVRYACSFSSQGTKSGERVVVQFEDKKGHFADLDELGMRSKMQKEVLELLNRERGFVLISAIPVGGLRSTTGVLLHKTDRFTREFMAVEDEAHPYEPIENIPVTVYKSSEDQTPATVLPRLFRFDPNVVVIRDLVDAKTIGLMCEEIRENRPFISTVRAKDCAEALLRVLALRVPPKLFAKGITAVLNQRLVRKLCDACKEAYAPTPQILQQLGIPPGRVQALYRPPQQPEEVCKECNGIGYQGRTAVFELMVVDDSVRKLLATGGKLAEIRKSAQKAGMRKLQTEGIVLVAKGITSLHELMRVMKL